MAIEANKMLEVHMEMLDHIRRCMREGLARYGPDTAWKQVCELGQEIDKKLMGNDVSIATLALFIVLLTGACQRGDAPASKQFLKDLGLDTSVGLRASQTVH